VVPILFPAIRQELGLSDTELGLVGGPAFSLIYALTSLVFGYAADRYPRKYLIALGLVLWSLATAAGGLANGFWSLFFARFFTGVGEASLYPCALSLIGERFPAAGRGRALGIFGAAAAIGGGLGVGLGGHLSQVLGFRDVFFWYGAVGLLCLPLLLWLREPPRDVAAQRESPWLAIRATIADKRLRLVWLCGTLAMASAQGFAAWGPSYFVRGEVLDVAQAGALFGISALIGGILGGVLGGAAADRRSKAVVGGELDVAALGALASAVLIGVTLTAPRNLAAATGVVVSLAIYGLFPGLLAAMLSLTPAHRHGIAGALNTLFVGGVGAAFGPFVVGAASDATGDLRLALGLPIAGFVAATVGAVYAGRMVRHDVYRKPAPA
jgi:MFS family permease